MTKTKQKKPSPAADQIIMTDAKGATPNRLRHRPAIRELHKREAEPAKGRREAEGHLLNLYRKLRYDERMAVYLFAERLALSRIEERRARRMRHV